MFELELQPFLLCYFPLFIVILGFIAYAVVTDANARRTYLRRTDMRPELEQLAMPGGAPPVNVPAQAETPTGLLFRRSGETMTVDGVPLQGHAQHAGDHAEVHPQATKSAVAAASEAAHEIEAVVEPMVEAVDMAADEPEVMVQTEAAAVAEEVEAISAEPTPPSTPIPTDPNDLRKIEGIGPKIQSTLNNAGIMSFAQLADRTPDDIRAILKAAGININANNPETWAEQAAFAAAGDWDGLETLQNELVGGRRRRSS